MTFMDVKDEAWELSHPDRLPNSTRIPPDPDRTIIEPMLSELTEHPDLRVSLLACAVAMRLGYWIPT